MPHDKDHVLANVHKAGATEVEGAIATSAQAWEDWHRLPWEERAAVFLRAAELLAGPWRSTSRPSSGIAPCCGLVTISKLKALLSGHQPLRA
jgi:1-pyrroline-5-carboxylate dehydrogenase